MKKFCVKCGAELSEDDEFCPKCGKKVKSSKSSTGKKKVLPFVIGGGIGVLVLVIVLVVVLLGSGTGGNDSKSVALEYCNAQYSGDADKVIDLMLPDEYDMLLKYKYLESFKKGIKENKPNKYTCEYEEKERLTGDDLDEVKSYLSEYVTDLSNVSEVYSVRINITEDDKNGYANIFVIKYGNKYYVDIYQSLFSFAQSNSSR